jgi:hypothetical protein
MANPKIEFFRFQLKPKKDDFKTFREFAIDELKVGLKSNNETVLKSLFKHFIESLEMEFAKDERIKKRITLIKKSNVNQYLSKRPVFNSANNTIYGVINGGPYGRDRILSDIDDQEDSSSLGQKKAVLQYFYFLLYLPTDHNEGCVIIHSNGSDESITKLFKRFIGHLFKGNNFNKVVCNPFCPKSFQEEFKKGATLQSLFFKSTFLEEIHTTDGMSKMMDQYDIKIEAIPKNKTISVTKASQVLDFLSKKFFGSSKKTKSLGDFETTKMVAENSITDSKKTFEWNAKDNEFVPVIYLNGRISKFNLDGTPDFDELDELCKNYFKDEVLPEIRPDLYVSRAN